MDGFNYIVIGGYFMTDSITLSLRDASLVKFDCVIVNRCFIVKFDHIIIKRRFIIEFDHVIIEEWY